MSVLVLAGGLSHERDISLRSGARVAHALRAAGVEVHLSDLDARVLDRLWDGSTEAVVNMLHGGVGEDGSLQSALEAAGVPCVGAGAAAAARTYDKAVAAGLLADAGLHVPDQLVASHELFRELGASRLVRGFVEALGLPLVVKPRRGGSALGVSLVRSADELGSALIGALGYDRDALVQRYVGGREVSVGIVDDGSGARCLTPVQVRLPAGELFDYNLRYTAGSVELAPYVDEPGGPGGGCAGAALRAFEVLGLRDLARADMVVDEDGVPHVLEVAVVPGMAETSLMSVALDLDGVDVPRLWADLTAHAAGRSPRAGRTAG